MSRLATWIATIVLLLAAGIVSSIAPADDAEVAPFPISGEIGEQLIGRDIAATVTDARTATSLTADAGWQSEGNWLVIDLTVASITGPAVAQLTAASALHGADFVIDGRTFRASERMPSLLGERLFPGLPRQGSLAFELPALQGAGVLQLSLTDDTRADSVLEIAIDLDGLTPAGEDEVLPTGWTQ